MTLKNGAKFEEKLTCRLENDMRNLAKFSPEHSKVSKLELWWDPFFKKRKCMSLKFTGEFCVMTMKKDTSWRGTELSF